MATDPLHAIITFITFIDTKISKERSLTSKQIHDWRHNHQKAASTAKTSTIENALGREINLVNLPQILKVSYFSFPSTQVLINNIIANTDTLKFPDFGCQQTVSFKQKLKAIPTTSPPITLLPNTNTKKHKMRNTKTTQN